MNHGACLPDKMMCSAPLRQQQLSVPSPRRDARHVGPLGLGGPGGGGVRWESGGEEEWGGHDAYKRRSSGRDGHTENGETAATPVTRDLSRVKADGDRTRKHSGDLRREIESFGGSVCLARARRRRRAQRKLQEQPKPEPEPEEEGPVSPEEFLRAAAEGKLKAVERFLEAQGNPDTCDQLKRTALHRSAVEGYEELMKRLLESGARVDLTDRLGSTAVHWACRGGSVEALKLLQEHGARVSDKDKAMSTPLHVAVRTGRAGCVEHLLACGADVNSRDREGDTPLHDAVRLGRPRIVRLLVLHGAGLQIKNAERKTPLDLVRKWESGTCSALKGLAASG
ncbi:unnamed protein product [Lampetra fluviatilis]